MVLADVTRVTDLRGCQLTRDEVRASHSANRPNAEVDQCTKKDGPR